MQLTLEQIKCIATGACSITQDEQGIHFNRFSQRQKDILASKNQKYYDRSCCTAGCRLDFYTDSKNIVIQVVSGKKYEILVDGLPSHFFSVDGTGRLCASLPAGEKRVTVTLPNYSEGIISWVALDEGSSIRPYQGQKRFLFLGDSITQGNQASRDSCCFANILSQYFDAEIRNWGIGSSHMDSETLEICDFDPDVVFIAYGTNDYGFFSSLDELETACRAYFSRVKELYGSKKIFYISPLWRADGDLVRKTGTLAECRDVLIRQCHSHGFIHIDGYRMVPHVPFYFNDGFLHPNDVGFSIYSRNLIKEVLNYI